MKQELINNITEKIIQRMEQGDLPWTIPFKNSGASCGLPNNPASGTRYRGFNIFVLWAQGFKDARWMTFNQIKKQGGHIKRGEKSTQIIFWKFIKKEEDGELVSIPLLRYYRVFNIEQTTLDTDTDFEPSSHDFVNDYLEREEIDLVATKGRAFYRPSTDSIHLPKDEDFINNDHRLSTLFHEAIHSTGHKDRLNRLSDDPYHNKAEYSKEELVAEFGSAMLCAITGTATEEIIENSAAYIQSWSKAIKNNPDWIYRACQDAQKALDFIEDKKYSS